jgi:serine/threonine-protein kinase
MDAKRFSRIEELYHAALDTAEDQRESFLDRACAGDESLLAEIKGLLATRERMRLDDPAGAAAMPDRSGQRLGPYLIDRLIGSGGMGAVYLAHRADGEYERQVALKVLRGQLAGEFHAARFRLERQTLASLSHPNIPSLLDGGVTDEGEPFLVMEYVEGIPIDRHADSRRLTIEGRLKLFRDVCAAVSYAHRSLVVHRDLKPSNILVTPGGEVKLLDFGTARLLAAEGEQGTLTGFAPLTPRYASPEQLSGGPVGIATDIYSLGILLYELLTGASPFEESQSVISAMARALAETDPKPPADAVSAEAAESRSATAARLKRELHGDLALILGKALACDPARRYESVAQLSADIGNYLENRPVIARRPTLLYGASRFVRRNRAGSALALVAAMALIAAALVSIREARIAQTEAARALRATTFLENSFVAGDLLRERPGVADGKAPVTVLDVLDRSSSLLDTEFQADPETAVRLCVTLGYVYYTHGALDKAEPLLARCHERAAAGGFAYYRAMAAARLGQVRFFAGKYREAEPLLRHAAAYARRRADALAPEIRILLLNELAVIVNQLYPPNQEAVDILRETYDVAKANPATVLAADRATIGSNLGWVLAGRGEIEASERLFREAAEIQRGIRPMPAEMTSTSRGWSNIHYMRGDFESAYKLLDEAVRGAAERLDARNPAMLRARIDRAYADGARGNASPAAAELRMLLQEFEKQRTAKHIDLAQPLVRLGQVLRLAGEPREARELLRQGREILLANGRDGDFGTAQILLDAGLCERSMGNAAEGAKLLDECHRIAARALGDANPFTQRVRGYLQSGR